jgi:urease accessory protein
VVDGLLHPFTGTDHVAAMVAVGVWSALAARRVWVAPLAFLAMLVVGSLAGLGGLAVPAVEPMIAVSLLALGLLLALQAPLPLRVAAALVGVFAFFHGAAHGSELAGGLPAWPALAGMALGTAVLHAVGIGLGQWVFRGRRWLSAPAGGAVAVLGSALLWRLAA